MPASTVVRVRILGSSPSQHRSISAIGQGCPKDVLKNGGKLRQNLVEKDAWMQIYHPSAALLQHSHHDHFSKNRSLAPDTMASDNSSCRPRDTEPVSVIGAFLPISRLPLAETPLRDSNAEVGGRIVCYLSQHAQHWKCAKVFPSIACL